MEANLNNTPHFNISVREFNPEDPPIRLGTKESLNESQRNLRAILSFDNESNIDINSRDNKNVDTESDIQDCLRHKWMGRFGESYTPLKVP